LRYSLFSTRQAARFGNTGETPAQGGENVALHKQAETTAESTHYLIQSGAGMGVYFSHTAVPLKNETWPVRRDL
jgi:hypothetical protein